MMSFHKLSISNKQLTLDKLNYKKEVGSENGVLLEVMQNVLIKNEIQGRMGAAFHCPIMYA